MSIRFQKAAALSNFSRYNPNSGRGFYESYFIRANHPKDPKAFWIRYTLFSPKSKPKEGIGELWAIYFDGAEIFSSKTELPWSQCQFPRKQFSVQIGDSYINNVVAKGQSNHLQWDINYSSEQPPLFLLPLSMYTAPFPKAKSIVSQPFAVFSGSINISNKQFLIDNWLGSQNHNWGQKHTDFYAWGQVAGFDNSPATFLEIVTAKLVVGGIDTPFITLMVLRHEGSTYQLNTTACWLRNKGSFDYFQWDFECMTQQIVVKGQIKASKDAFIGLKYKNPIGGFKNCLNSKLASCSLEINETKATGMPQALYTQHRCAFEILTNEGKEHHGIHINF